jgi:hypothetical protein
MNPDQEGHAIEAALLKEAVDRLEREADEFEKKLEKKFDEYILKLVFEGYKERLDDRIKPLERLVYGIVGLILISVMTALIATVVVQ